MSDGSPPTTKAWTLHVCPKCGSARVALLGEDSFFNCGGGVHLPGVSGGAVAPVHDPVTCERVVVARPEDVLARAAEGLRERAEYPHHRPNGKKDEFTSTFDYMGKGVTEAVADWLERFAREWGSEDG